MAHRYWTTANFLTFIRIVLTLPFLYYIYTGHYAAALLVFFIASITDFADGYVARRFNQFTPLGQLLDPLADKLLTTAAFVVMAIPRQGFPSIPIWLAVVVIARDVLILLGSLIVTHMTGVKEFKPTLFGKVNTFLELGLIVVFLAFHTFNVLTFLLPLCYFIVLVSALVSGIDYVLIGLKIIKAHRNKQGKNGREGEWDKG